MSSLSRCPTVFRAESDPVSTPQTPRLSPCSDRPCLYLWACCLSPSRSHLLPVTLPSQSQHPPRRLLISSVLVTCAGPPPSPSPVSSSPPPAPRHHLFDLLVSASLSTQSIIIPDPLPPKGVDRRTHYRELKARRDERGGQKEDGEELPLVGYSGLTAVCAQSVP